MKIAEVFFKGNKKPYYFKTEIMDLMANESVVVGVAGGSCRVAFSRYVNMSRFTKGLPSKSILYRNKVLSDRGRELTSSNINFLTAPVRLVTSSDGDWQGLYLNEDLVEEGHSISLSAALEKVTDFATSIKATAKFFSYEIDSDDLENIGGLPKEYGDLVKIVY